MILSNVDWKFIQNHTYKIARILPGDIPRYYLHKKLVERGKKLNHTLSGMCDHGTLTVFKTHINTNCEKCIIVEILIFSQSTPMHMPKNLENVPAQDLIQLRHSIVLHYYFKRC